MPIKFSFQNTVVTQEKKGRRYRLETEEGQTFLFMPLKWKFTGEDKKPCPIPEKLKEVLHEVDRLDFAENKRKRFSSSNNKPKRKDIIMAEVI